MYRNCPTLRVEQLEARDLLSISAFPSTANALGVLSDQLPGTLSDALVRFVATHMVGTQKMLSSQTARFRAINPGWVELHYQLGTDSGPVPYIVNDQWGSDWSTVNAHEDWFLHDPSGNRLSNSQWNWYQNDISNPAWRQYWLSSVIADMRAEGSQGVFADSFQAGIGSFWYDQSDPRFAGTNAANPAAWPNGDTWTQQLGDLISYMEAGLAATPEHFLYIPNLGPLVTGWDNTDYSHVDGAFLEDFGDWGGGYLHGSPGDWVLSMNRALELSDAGKVLIVQPYLADAVGTPTGQLHREFLLGTYLLLKGDHTYLNMMAPGGGVNAEWFPEYSLNLGPAVTPLASNVSQYLWNGVYRRDFQNGIVLVNPGPSTITVNLGRTMQNVTGTGGGVLTDASLDAQGNYVGGSLSATAASQVTLVPGQAAILTYGPPSTTPAGPGTTLPPPVTPLPHPGKHPHHRKHRHVADVRPTHHPKHHRRRPHKTHRHG
jgi:hypothetical protein